MATLNIIKQYVKLDGTLLKQNNAPIIRGSNNSSQIQLITPQDASLTTEISFLTASGRELGYYTMTQEGTEDVSVTAGDFEIGLDYEITELGSTDFTAIGASSNQVGVVFTATGVGSGTGTANGTWNIWLFDLTSAITSTVALLKSSPLKNSFRFREPDALFYGTYDTELLLPTNPTSPTLIEGNFATITNPTGGGNSVSYYFNELTNDWSDLGYLRSIYASDSTTTLFSLAVSPSAVATATALTSTELEAIQAWLNTISNTVVSIANNLVQTTDGAFDDTDDDVWSSDKRIGNHLAGYLDKTTYDTNSDGIVNKAAKLENGNVSIEDIANVLTARGYEFNFKTNNSATVYSEVDVDDDAIVIKVVNPNGTSTVTINDTGDIILDGYVKTLIKNLLKVEGNTIEFGEDNKELTYNPVDGSLYWDTYEVLTTANLPEIGFPTTPVSYVQFATGASAPTHVNGKYFWDSVKQQPAFYVRNANTQVNPGYEVVAPVVNKSGNQIINGTVVYPTGYSDDLDGVKAFEIGLADNRYKLRANTIAVLTQTLADTESGNVVKFGLASDIDLLALGFTYVEQPAYLGHDGLLTPTRPTDGEYPTLVGFVVDIGTPGNSDGVLQVDILETEFTAEVNDKNGFPPDERFKTTMSIDDATRKFTLSASERYHFYELGVKYERIPGNNILTNNFTESTQDWLQSGGATATLESLNDALRVTSTNSTSFLTVSKAVNLNEGQKYRVRLRVRSNQGITSIKTYLGATSGTASNTIIPVTAGQWNSVDFEAYAQENNVIGIEFSGNADGYLYDIDYVIIDETSSVDDTITFSDVEGLHIVYFDMGTLTIINSVTESDIETVVLTKSFVAAFYWDATNQQHEFILDERHGVSMSPATHLRLHQGDGTIYRSGMTIDVINIDVSNPTDDTAIEFNVASGVNKDEDIQHAITEKQTTDVIREYAFIGANKDLRRQSENQYGASALSVGQRLSYNLISGGVGSVAEAPDNTYLFRLIVAIPEVDKTRTNYFSFMGYDTYASEEAAIAGAPDELSTFLTNFKGIGTEFTIVGLILYQTKTSYSAPLKSRIVSIDGGEFLDYRTAQAKGVGGLSQDHIDLAGRNDADQHNLAAITNQTSGDYISAGETAQLSVEKLDNQIKSNEDNITILETKLQENAETTKEFSGQIGDFNTDKDGTLTTLDGKNVIPHVNYSGRTLDWLVSNPDFRDGTTGKTIVGSVSIANSQATFTGATANAVLRHDLGFSPSAGQLVYIGFNVISNDLVGSGTIYINSYSTDDISDGLNPITVSQGLNGTIVTAVGGTIDTYITLWINSGFTSGTMVIDNLFAIPLPSDITTQAQMEDLLDGTIRDKGVYSVGNLRSETQLIDNSNDFGNWTLGGTVNKTFQKDNIPYISVTTAVSNDYNANIQTSTTYTLFTHIIKNNAGTNQFYVASGSQYDITTIFADASEVGLRKDLITTGASATGIHRSGTGASVDVIYRQIILQGDWTNYPISDDEWVKIVQSAENTVDFKGIYGKTIGKNKFDILFHIANFEHYRLVDFGGFETWNYTASGDADDYRIMEGEFLEGEQYTLTLDGYSVGASANLRIYYTDGTFTTINLIADTWTHIEQTTTSGKTVDYIRTVFNSSQEVYIRINSLQLELGTVATDYERYEEQFSRIITEDYGLIGITEDTADDLHTQRNDRDYNDAIKNYTGTWTLDNSLTNTIRIFGAIGDILPFKRVPTTSDIGKAKYSLNKQSLPIVAPADSTGTDEEMFAIPDNENFRFRLLKSKLSTLDDAGVKAYLASVDVEFIYELDEYKPRTLENNNLIEYNGLSIVSDKSTFEQLGQGVLGYQAFDISINLNDEVQLLKKGLQKTDTQTQIQEVEINNIFDRVNTLEQEILYINPSPSAHTGGDSYTFRSAIEDNQKVTVYFSTSATGDPLYSASAYFINGSDFDFDTHSTGSSVDNKHIYFEGTGGSTTVMSLAQSYEIAHINASTPSIATKVIYVFAIIAEGGFRL